jgi:hypothetical protein
MVQHRVIGSAEGGGPSVTAADRRLGRMASSGGLGTSRIAWSVGLLIVASTVVPGWASGMASGVDGLAPPGGASTAAGGAAGAAGAAGRSPHRHPESPGDSAPKRARTVGGGGRVGGPPPPIPDAALDCALRGLALQTAVARVGSGRGRAAAIYDGLRLHECGLPRPPLSTAAPPPPSAPPGVSPRGTTPLIIQVIVSPAGDDSNPGTLAAPVRTAHAARDLVRKARRSIVPASSAGTVAPGGLAPAEVLFHAGIYHFGADGGTLTLGAADGHTVYRPLAATAGDVVFTGAAPRTLHLRSAVAADNAPRHDACVADMDWPGTNPDVDLLFDVGTGANFVWAREPNGNPFRDLQPTGYALADGDLNGTLPDRSLGQHIEIDHPPRNSSVYPVWGKDFDPRGPAVWYTQGGAGSRFAGNSTFWNGTVSAGLRWNATGGVTQHGYNVSGFRASKVRDPERAVLHAFQRAYWGNQQCAYPTPLRFPPNRSLWGCTERAQSGQVTCSPHTDLGDGSCFLKGAFARWTSTARRSCSKKAAGRCVHARTCTPSSVRMLCSIGVGERCGCQPAMAVW